MGVRHNDKADSYNRAKKKNPFHCAAFLYLFIIKYTTKSWCLTYAAGRELPGNDKMVDF